MHTVALAQPIPSIQLHIAIFFFTIYHIESFWQYCNITFALVGCTCTKTPVFFLHSLFSIFLFKMDPRYFQHLFSWLIKTSFVMSLLSQCSRHMLSNMFGTSNCNKVTVLNPNTYRSVRIAIHIVSASNYRFSIVLRGPWQFPTLHTNIYWTKI